MSGKALLLCFTLFAGLMVAFTFEISHTASTCLHCRATLNLRTVGGFPSEHIEHNSYSRAYLKRDPAHQHHWCKLGCTESDTLLSKGFACGRGHPIWQVPVAAHARYAETVSPAELQAALQTIDSKDKAAVDAMVRRIFEHYIESL